MPYFVRMPSYPPPLTVGEISAQTGIPARTVRYAILNKHLKAHKLPGETGAYVVSQRDLDKWLAKREQSEATA
jgi:excisionase family DNA binding protein